MRAYIDTNVIIDAFANREPYSKEAQKIFELIAERKAVGCITSSAFTDIYYISRCFINDEKLKRQKMAIVLFALEVLDTMAISCKVALDSPLNDYEDALIEEISYINKLDCIVTRNVKDFNHSRVEILTPQEFIKRHEINE